MNALGHNGGPDLGFDEENDDPLRLRVIRIHINDWAASTRGLSLEEEGFFWRFTLLMYDRMGVLADDDRINSRAMGIDIRSYRFNKNKLVAMGKIRIEEGRLNHPRIVREIERYVAEYKRRSDAAKERENRKREAAVLNLSSYRNRPELVPKSDRYLDDTEADLLEKLNKINGTTTTTVPTAEPQPSCARAFPKPKPKPIEESKIDSLAEPPNDPLEIAFTEFWEAFPGSAPPKGRKTDKPKVRDLFRRIVTGRHPSLRAKAVDIISAARRYNESKPDPKWIPMPATWLNGGRWLDVVQPKVAPQFDSDYYARAEQRRLEAMDAES